MRVMVIGAGACGVTLAAHLASRGVSEVLIAEIPQFHDRVDAIARADGMLTVEGMLDFRARVQPSEIAAAGDCDYLLIATTADAHATIAECLAASLVKRTKAVVYFPGNLGSLFLARRLSSISPVMVVEVNSSPYGVRMLPDRPTGTRVSALTPHLLCSGVIAADHDLEGLLRFLAPEIEAGGTPESVILSNPNPLFHTLPCLLSAGRIEYAHGNFFLYKEGITPHVRTALRAKDAERMRLIAAVGSRGLRWEEMRSIVEVDGERQDKEFIECGREANFPGPDSLHHRYVVEDTTAGLVCWERIGQLRGVPTPITSAVVTLFSVLLGEDLRERGAERAGLLNDRVREWS